MTYTDDHGHPHFAPTIIPATAGAYTALAWVRLDDLAGHAVELPVIGFDCGAAWASPKPITILRMEVQAIRCADGRIIDLIEACEFSNRGDWQRHAKDRANKWAEETTTTGSQEYPPSTNGGPLRQRQP